MPNFATEQDVRDKFQLTDTTLVASELFTDSIDDAHTQILRHLDPVHDTGSPDAALVLGETLLAGAHLLRSIASKTAFDLKDLSIGGRRIEPGNRFEALNATADHAEASAWAALEPFLLSMPVRAPLDVSDSTPVLGAE